MNGRGDRQGRPGQLADWQIKLPLKPRKKYQAIRSLCPENRISIRTTFRNPLASPGPL